MKKKSSISAFTLGEVIIVILIMGILALFVLKMYSMSQDFVKKHEYYASFSNLKRGVGELVAGGSSDQEAYDEAYAQYQQALVQYEARLANVNSLKAQRDAKYQEYQSLPDTIDKTTSVLTRPYYDAPEYKAAEARVNEAKAAWWNVITNAVYNPSGTFGPYNCGRLRMLDPKTSSDYTIRDCGYYWPQYCYNSYYELGTWYNESVAGAVNVPAWYSGSGGPSTTGWWVVDSSTTSTATSLLSNYLNVLSVEMRTPHWENYNIYTTTTTSEPNPAKAQALSEYNSLDSQYQNALSNLGTEPVAPQKSATDKILPNKGYVGNGEGLCEKFVKTFSTVGALDCSKTTTSIFDDSTVNFTLANGAKFYNLGANPTSSPTNNPLEQIYTIYVDIDGSRGKSTLNDDVMMFKVDRNGLLLPDITSEGANSTKYLSASVKARDKNGVVSWLTRGVSYRKAVCQSGEVTSTTYCTGGSDYSKRSECDVTGTLCETVINKP